MFPHPTVVNPNLSRLTMNIVKFFEKSEIRFVDHPEGKYGFGIVADDLAEVLEASHGFNIARSVKDKWKSIHSIDSRSGKISLTTLYEGNEISVSNQLLPNKISVSNNNEVNEISWEKIIIWEPGIYQLLAVSRKEKAEPFQDWLFEDVLPSIRKTGSYLPESLLRDRGAVSR